MTIRRGNGIDKVQVVQQFKSSKPFFTFPRVHREKRGSKIRFERSGAIERLERFEPDFQSSAAAGKNHRQLFGWNDFELGVRAVARFLVRAPPAKLRGVTETAALHVVVSDFDDQFGT